MKPEGGEMLVADEGGGHEPRNASNFWKLKHTNTNNNETHKETASPFKPPDTCILDF